MQPKLLYTGHHTYAPKTMVRALMGESDSVFSPAKQQMRDMTSVMDTECATPGPSERDCLSASGYGYYLVAGGAHDFSLHAGTGPDSLLENLNWLASKASSGPTVQTLV